MDTLTFVHSADFHLGTAFKGFGPQIGRQRRKELMQALTGTVETCLRHKADVLFIAGDLWQQEYVTRPLVEFVGDQFRRMPQVQVIIAPGEADSNWQGSYYHTFPWPNNVHIFSGDLSSFYFPRLNLRVHGLAWTGSTPPANQWSTLEISPSESQVLQVLIAHGDPEQLGMTSDLMEDRRLAYVALGHKHKHCKLAPAIVYSGSPEPLGFSETERHGVILGKINAGALHTELIPLAQRKCVSLSLEICSEKSMTAIAEDIMQLIKPFEPETNMIRLELRGKHGKQWSLTDLEQLLSDLWYCSIDDRTEPELELDALLAEHKDSLVGHYISTLSSNEQQPEVIQRALSYGLDALLTKGVRIW